MEVPSAIPCAGGAPMSTGCRLVHDALPRLVAGDLAGDDVVPAGAICANVSRAGPRA